MNKRQAISEARASADAIIEQLTRWSNGWDKGVYRDDVTREDMAWKLPTAQIVAKEAEHAFALSIQFTELA